MSAFDPLRTFGPPRVGSGTDAAREHLRSVPRFYFHLHNDVDIPDDEGVELPDLKAARAYAVRSARVTFAEVAKDDGRVVLHHRIDIEDEQGTVLSTVYFRDAVNVEE